MFHFLSNVIRKSVPTRWLDRYQKYRYAKSRSAFKQLPTKAVFEKIHQSKRWGEGESISGPGSSLMATGGIVAGLQKFVADYHIASMVDAPCGDFHWMQQLNFSNLKYLGCDIVEALIQQNTKQFGNETYNSGPSTLSPMKFLLVMFCSTEIAWSIFPSMIFLRRSKTLKNHPANT